MYITPATVPRTRPRIKVPAALNVVPPEGLSQNSRVADATRESLLIEEFHQRQGVLARRVEHVAHLGDVQASRFGKALDDPPADVRKRFGAKRNALVNSYDASLTDQRSHNL